MAWKKIAGSCEVGACPTFHLNPASGAVRVQGARVQPHIEIPGHEGMLEISAPDWQNLIRQYLAEFPQ